MPFASSLPVSEFLLYAVAFNLKKAAGDGGLNREESIKKGSGGPTRSRWRQNMSPPEENKAQYNGNEEEKIRNRSLCKGKTLTGEEGSDLSPI